MMMSDYIIIIVVELVLKNGCRNIHILRNYAFQVHPSGLRVSTSLGHPQVPVGLSMGNLQLK